MDVEQMMGSTVQAMAEAVENADIVLICLSHKYKNSENCRQGTHKQNKYYNYSHLLYCFTSTKNIYGHVGTVSSPNHTFPGQA